MIGGPYVVDPTMPLGGFLSPYSVFRADLRSAPPHPNSDALVASLATQVAAHSGGIAAFNAWQYNLVLYTVGSQQAKVDLIWDDCQNRGYVPASLSDFMTGVPIPSDAQPSAGTDHSLGIYQPSSDTFWGFWKAVLQPDGWHACWGGKVAHASQSRGWYLDGEGVSATGLADGASIGINEAFSGQINHAVGIGLPSPADWHRFSWPAIRSDGGNYSPTAIPEGLRFRLPANVDLTGLHPLAAMIARAAQKYGLIVMDTAGTVGVSVESGGPTQQVTGVNPWTALLAGTPSYLVMKGFPWAKLQALPVDYGRS